MSITAPLASPPADGRLPETRSPVFSRTFPPITRHTLALYCGASGDTNPIHVDSDFAKASGFPDVFAHGMLVMAYLGVALEESGPRQGLRAFAARFVSITQLGAIITCEGRVADIDDETATLDLIAKDQAGDVKLAGSASVDRATWGGIIGKA